MFGLSWLKIIGYTEIVMVLSGEHRPIKHLLVKPHSSQML